MDAYYQQWEETHLLPNGLFWSFDNYDAMEFSISGTTPEGVVQKGCRPTLNAYLCADAEALAWFAQKAGMQALADQYLQKHQALKQNINTHLWKDGFYRAFHFETEEDLPYLFETNRPIPMELLGYIPFMFQIPPKERDSVFEHLLNPNIFFTPIGITTADMREARFLEPRNHACLWNGYVWPFATAQTLTGLLCAVKRSPENQTLKEMYFRLLNQYAASHTIQKEEGQPQPWIDEMLHPFSGDWQTRSHLQAADWQTGAYRIVERGKDYNHSTFCDLVLSALTGITCTKEGVQFQPIIPNHWDYFKIENLFVQGNCYTLLYDKTGKIYGKGAGFFVLPHCDAPS